MSQNPCQKILKTTIFYYIYLRVIILLALWENVFIDYYGC
jgi:hypothetical protein